MQLNRFLSKNSSQTSSTDIKFSILVNLAILVLQSNHLSCFDTTTKYQKEVRKLLQLYLCLKHQEEKIGTSLKLNICIHAGKNGITVHEVAFRYTYPSIHLI